MEDSKNKKSPAADSKKKARQQIENKLEAALSNLRPILGKKKFKRRIKKAGKLLADGVKNLNSNGSVKTKKEKSAPTSIKTESAE